MSACGGKQPVKPTVSHSMDNVRSDIEAYREELKKKALIEKKVKEINAQHVNAQKNRQKTLASI